MHAWQRYYKDKTIWITGASSGLGLAIFRHLAALPCQLIISGRNKEKLNKIANKKQNTMVLAFDVQHEKEHQHAAELIKQQFGTLDLVIFNAGSCDYVSADDFKATPFQHMINTNFMSLVYGIAATLPLLRASKNAHIVGISSAIAYGGLGQAAAYGASKAAMKNMLECLRIDLLKSNIFVSIVCPGFIDTPLTRKNDFNMPGMISADKAATHIVKKIAAQQYEIITPRWFCILMKLIHSLPTWLSLSITKHTSKKLP